MLLQHQSLGLSYPHAATFKSAGASQMCCAGFGKISDIFAPYLQICIYPDNDKYVYDNIYMINILTSSRPEKAIKTEAE